MLHKKIVSKDLMGYYWSMSDQVKEAEVANKSKVLHKIEATLAAPGETNITPKTEGQLVVEDALAKQAYVKAYKKLGEMNKEGNL